MTRVVVYSKQGCHLCERVISELETLSSEYPIEINVQDITSDPELFERYKDKIPVLSIEGRVALGGAVLSNPRTLEGTLRKALG